MHHVNGTFDTPLGKFRFVLTEANHVVVGTRQDREDAVEFFTVHRVDYRVDIHLYRQQDGSWSLRSNLTDNDYAFYHNINLRRYDDSFEKGSQSAREKVLATIPAAWKEFIDHNDANVAGPHRLRVKAELDKAVEKTKVAKQEAEDAEKAAIAAAAKYKRIHDYATKILTNEAKAIQSHWHEATSIYD